MNQDVYRIGKCFSRRDCVIKITCKTSLLVSLFDDDVVLCFFQEAVYIRQDWSAPRLMPQHLSGKCTSGPNKSTILGFTFWFGCYAPIVCWQGMWLLGTKCRVDHNAQKCAFLVLFLGMCCCFSLLYIKSVPVRFLNVHCRTAECFYWLLFRSLECTALKGLKGVFWRHRWLYLKACTVI